MFNPWKDLPTKPPYVHPEDMEDLDKFYYHRPKEQRPRTDMIPNPVAGNPIEAKVILLSKTPLYDEQMVDDYENVPGYLEANRKSLTFENTGCPFFFIDPRFESTGPYRWWQTKLSTLIEDVGFEAVSTRLAAVTYFPYHVEAWNNPGEMIYTQRHFCRDLARQARDAGKVVVMVNFGSEWKKELKFDNPIALRGAQNAAISSKTVVGGRYADIVAALKDPEAEVEAETEAKEPALAE